MFYRSLYLAGRAMTLATFGNVGTLPVLHCSQAPWAAGRSGEGGPILVPTYLNSKLGHSSFLLGNIADPLFRPQTLQGRDCVILRACTASTTMWP